MYFCGVGSVGVARGNTFSSAAVAAAAKSALHGKASLPAGSLPPLRSFRSYQSYASSRSFLLRLLLKGSTPSLRSAAVGGVVRDRPALHGGIVRCTAVAADTPVSSAPRTSDFPTTKDTSGASIRERFLQFYEAQGHARKPSASLIPDDPTIMLTIAGMVPFKPIFMGTVPRDVPCATSTQKCVRTNDIENVGRTPRHHTFFEMLGNFSFGDYFKEQAVKYAWEISTQEFEIPKDRIWITVFEEDDETVALWRDVIGVAENRIVKFGAKDNFWASGPTGPCGPCTELYYDFHPEKGEENVDFEDGSRFMEFYNVVFMQYERTESQELIPLASPNIDTGMGLERMACILQGVGNNYETDLMRPIMEKVAQLANLKYEDATEKQKLYLKVCGDHARSVVYMVSDGVNPSNVGRGYIVRRLIRRLVRCMRMLGIRGDRAFLPEICQVAVDMAGPVDPQVAINAPRIFAELKREELRFCQTLERGEKLLEDLVAAASEAPEGERFIKGKDAFLLYDTFGFPVEITEEVAEERGLTVDMPGFKEEMEAQRQRAKAARETVKLAMGGEIGELASDVGETAFLGYDSLVEEDCAVLGLAVDGKLVEEISTPGAIVQIVLNQTPFYAESGGQVGDNGKLIAEGACVAVTDVQKAGGGSMFLHTAILESGTLKVGDSVRTEVDEDLRRRAKTNHTSTHLLQSALKEVVDGGITQAGSLVDFERLRFDFNCPRPVTPEEISQVEALINGWIGEAIPLETQSMAIDDAKAAGAVAMFGEKYGDEVRVVDVPGVSMELCGGTHVSNTAEIGAFKVLSEQGIASGIRRIEAVSGPGVVELLNERDSIVRSLISALNVKPDELVDRVASLQKELKQSSKEMVSLKGELAMLKSDALASEAEAIGSATVLLAKLEGVDPAALKTAAEKLQARLGDSSFVLLASVLDTGKLNLIGIAGKQAVEAGVQAGKLVGMAAKACGGGGGGRPNFAQAGGKDASQLEQALEQVKAEIAKAVE